MTATFILFNLTEPDYMTLTDYERNFDLTYWRKTFSQYWILSIYISAIYLIVVYKGVAFMKNRKPFKIDGLLTAWNIGLSVMSIWASYRLLPEVLHILSKENGFYHSVCEWKEHSPANAFWGFVLLLSKVIELGDTAFIVLRKKKLLFLHYYHHVITLLCWWYMYQWYEPSHYWTVVMNSCVHSLMYPYYTLRSMKISVPKVIAMLVTSFQLLQMFVGLFINLYSFWRMHLNGTPADCPHRCWDGIFLALGAYIVFVFLFGKLFINSYLNKRIEKSKKV